MVALGFVVVIEGIDRYLTDKLIKKLTKWAIEKNYTVTNTTTLVESIQYHDFDDILNGIREMRTNYDFVLIAPFFLSFLAYGMSKSVTMTQMENFVSKAGEEYDKPLSKYQDVDFVLVVNDLTIKPVSKAKDFLHTFYKLLYVKTEQCAADKLPTCVVTQTGASTQTRVASWQLCNGDTPVEPTLFKKEATVDELFDYFINLFDIKLCLKTDML